MPHAIAFHRLLRCLNQAQHLNLAADDQPSPKSVTRRRFIKTAMNAGVLATAISAMPKAFAASKKIVVIGAGLAGLNAAYQLKKAGVDAVVYEASNRVGGRIRTVKGQVGPGLETDLGGELVNTNHTDLLGLAEEFGIGLTSRKEPNDALQKVGFYFGGRFYPEAELAEILRPFAAQMMEDANALDEDWGNQAPRLDAMSVADYLDRYQNLIPKSPDIRRLMESVVEVEYGVPANNSSALQLLFSLPSVDGEQVELISESDEAYVLNGGSESVIANLTNILSEQIHLNSPLTRLEKSGSEYKLWIGEQEPVLADYVVLALPLPALRKVELNVVLPTSLARFIKEVDLGRNEKIVAGVKRRVWRNPKGFEIEAWSDQSVGLIWDSSLRQLEQAEGSLTYFLSAHEVDKYSTGSANEQGQKLIQEFDTILPGLLQQNNQKFLRSAWYKTPGIEGAYTNFKPGQYTGLASEWLWVESDDAEERVEFAFEKLVFAGEHTSDEYYGFMNGAAESGRLAAEFIMRNIAQ